MNGLYKKALLAILVLPFFSPLSHAADTKAADTKKEAVAEAPKGSEIIFRVNGKDFKRDNLEIEVNGLMPLMSFHSSISDERMKQIEKTALDRLINSELIYEDAKRNKDTNVSGKEIDEEISNLKKKLPKGQSLNKVLKNSKMTMDELKEDFRRKIITFNYTKKKVDEFKKKSNDTVSDAFMKSYYEKNVEKFKEPEQIHLRSILIKADPAGGQKIWNESLKKAKDILKMAKEGQDFAKLAEKYSEDPYAKKGGDMGWAHQGSLFQEIDAVAANMKPGEVSEPIMTIYGYHILKLEARKASALKKFEDLNKDNLKKELEPKEYKKLWDAWINGLRGNAKIEYIAKDIKELQDVKEAN